MKPFTRTRPKTSEPAQLSGATGVTPDPHIEAAPTSDESGEATEIGTRRTTRLSGVFTRRGLVYAVLPAVALVLAVSAGYLKWLDVSARNSQEAGREAVQAAIEATTQMLSYQPASVDNDLKAAGMKMTGTFRETYGQLVDDVVIPGAREKRISSIATVPAAACVHATADSATVLVFVNQVVAMDSSPPSTTTSVVRITLDKSDDAWLVSDFTPI